MRAPKAYAAVARAALSDRLVWRADALLSVAMGAARVAMALVLWDAVFDGRAEVGGMSLRMVASYYVVAVFVFQFDQSAGLSEEFAAEIRMGHFGKYLGRPIDPLAWFLAAAAGRSAFQATAAMGAAIIVASLCAIASSSIMASLDPWGLLAAIPVILSGLFSLALINFMTATLAFAFQDVGHFQVAKNCAIEFLSGALLPLALLPPMARKALALTPFPALASLPADLAFGRGLEAFPGALACLAAWNLGLYLAARALFGSLSRRYEEMGS
jgi:ABC-2 type transport system permease protein